MDLQLSCCSIACMLVSSDDINHAVSHLSSFSLVVSCMLFPVNISWIHCWREQCRPLLVRGVCSRLLRVHTVYTVSFAVIMNILETVDSIPISEEIKGCQIDDKPRTPAQVRRILVYWQLFDAVLLSHESTKGIYILLGGVSMQKLGRV